MRVRWARRSALVVLCQLVVSAPDAFGGCAQTSCPIESILRLEQPANGGELLLDGSWEYIGQDQPRIGRHRADVGEKPSPEHDEVATINRRYRLLAEYGVTSRVSVGMLLPIVHLDHRHLVRGGDHDEGSENPDGENGETRTRRTSASEAGEAEGGSQRWSFTGVGDLQLWARYVAYRAAGPGGRSFTVGGGLKLPTGRTGVTNDDGDEAEMSLQPGTGSVDPILMASFVQPLSLRAGDGRQVWTPIFSAVNARIPGTDGRYGYRAGAEVVMTIGATYSLIPRIDLLGQMNFRWRDRDDAGNAPGLPEENTGGEALFVSPGIRARLWEGLAAYGLVQVPVYQRVNGIQLTSDWNVVLGLQYRLGLFGS